MPDFVQNRRNGGGPAPGRKFVVFGKPESSDLRMFNFQQHAFSKIGVSQELWNVQQGAAGIFEQGQDRIAQDMFQPGSPEIGPDLLEDRDQAGRHQIMIVGMDAFQRIESDGIFDIRRVEIDDIVYPFARNQRQDLFGQVAVGIDQRRAVPVPDIRDDHVLDQR